MLTRRIAIVLALFGVALLSRPLWAATLYVSSTGSDANTGRGPENAQALGTIQAAVERLQPGDTLLIRGGIYRETVTFPRSGEPGRPIAIGAYEGEEVTVSGCEPITGWTRDQQNIWKAPMPWTLGRGRNQVFAGGAVMIEARFPNTAAPGLEMYVAGLSPLWPTFGEFSIPDPVKQPGRVVGKLLEGQPVDYWKGALYYGVHYQGWCGQTGVIEGSQPGEITVGDRTRGWWFSGPYGGRYQPEEGRGMIVGHMHALDAPGEWHWQDNTLYFIPPNGTPPARVEAKRRMLAFDLSGREHIHIRGLRVQAASLRLDDSAHCVVDGCRLSYIAHFTRQYDMGQIEPGRNTIKSGETGIFVGGHDNAFLNCSIRISAGAGFHLRGDHHTIHNCLIDEVSYTSHYLNAITDAVSDYPEYENFLVGGHAITYNTMCNAGRHFFNFYGNGTSKASRDRGPMDYAATLFAHNHLYNGMLQTRDAGFLSGYFSSGGTLNGQNSQVVYNVLHDCYDIFGMRIGALGLVYLDEGTCDVDLHHNLLWAAPGSHQRGSWFNTCCANVREHHNLFHPQFTRTSATLVAEDFPEGRPFRFGHDFASPPPRPQWPQLVTVDVGKCASHSAGIGVATGRLSGLRDGDWCAFHPLDWSGGWRSAVVRLASGVQQMNTAKATRAAPRHHTPTDPLVLEMDANDGTEEHVRKQWVFLYSLGNKAWVRFNQVPLGQGYRRFRVVYGNDRAESWRLELRLDRVDGPLVGQARLPQTDRVRGRFVQICNTAVAELSPGATGSHDVFLVFQSESEQPALNIEYLRFEQYRGRLALQKNEVQLELRVGSKDGPKIGQFYPRNTGGVDAFREFVAPLEPAHGNEPLFLVVRSALAVPLGTIDGLRLEKAADPIMEGIGTPPRTDKTGRMVLPQPTNRPQARPDDRYVEERSARRGPRPLFVAGRLPAPPVVDGKLDEWQAQRRVMTLSESLDGSRSPALPSTAWIGYDDQAIYIAARHSVLSGPVLKCVPLLGTSSAGAHENTLLLRSSGTPSRAQVPATAHLDATALKDCRRLWGQSDGMEIALQDGGPKPGPICCWRGFPDGHFRSLAIDDASGEPVEASARGVTYRTAIEAGGWTGEWRIPFAACGLTPRTAPQVRFNLAVRKAADDSWVCWRGTGAATYNVALAGVLVFAGEVSAGSRLPRDGLVVWLDAADAATVDRDAAGKVAAWKNKGSQAGSATQAKPPYRPLYVPGAINGKPALRFTEKNATRLELADLSADKISATVFVVFSNPVPGEKRNQHPRLLAASDGRQYDYRVGLMAGVPGLETGGPRQMMASFQDRWAQKVRIGCFSPNYQTYFTGDIAEILVYARRLTPDEQDRVRVYLLSKWNL